MRNFFSILIVTTLLFGCAKEDHTHNYSSDQTTGTNFIIVDWNLYELGKGHGYYYVTLDVPDITSDVVENGAVLVYMTSSSWQNPEWVALPYTMVYDLDYFLFVNYSFSTSQVDVEWIYSDFDIPDYPAYDTFRVVVFEDRSSITDESILNLIEKFEEQK